MFALFAPICLCGSALTSTWAGREAEYAKQLEQRLITLELPRRKMVDFLDFFSRQPNKQVLRRRGRTERSSWSPLIALECLSDNGWRDWQIDTSELETYSAFTFSALLCRPAESVRFSSSVNK